MACNTCKPKRYDQHNVDEGSSTSIWGLAPAHFPRLPFDGIGISSFSSWMTMHSSMKPRRFPGWEAPPCEATRLEIPSDATRALRKSCDTLGTTSERIHGEVGVSVKKSSWAESLDFDVWVCQICFPLFSIVRVSADVCKLMYPSLWTGCSVANLSVETYFICGDSDVPELIWTNGN